MKRFNPPILITIGAILLVAGITAAVVFLTTSQTESVTKPTTSAASSSKPDVKVKNIIIQSKPTESATSSKASAQQIELKGKLHTDISSKSTKEPNDTAPSTKNSSKAQISQQSASQSIPVQSIETENNIKIAVGESYGINVQVKPLNATYKDVTWATSDDHIAKVDKTGMVTGVSTGKCTITVSTIDGKVTAKITVDVNA